MVDLGFPRWQGRQLQRWGRQLTIVAIFSQKLQGVEKSWAGVWASLAPPFDPPMSIIGQEQSIQCRQINVLGLNWTEKRVFVKLKYIVRGGSRIPHRECEYSKGRQSYILPKFFQNLKR